MTASILLPYSNNGCEHRDAARRYVLEHYASHHPDWELIEGCCDGAWSKGRAIADAASRASTDLFVLADADSLTYPEVLRDAVQRAESVPWVVPHKFVYRLNQHATERILNGGPLRQGPTTGMVYVGPPGGGITVLSRSTWQEVGGIDPRFLGWGGEDIAFGWALKTLCGRATRLNGPLFHLYHPREPQGEKQRGSPDSEALAGRYRDARGDMTAMRALINEHSAEGAKS